MSIAGVYSKSRADSYTGLSTDTKPTNARPGSRLVELDTGIEYVCDQSSVWYPKVSLARLHLITRGMISGAGTFQIIGYNGSIEDTMDDVTELGASTIPIPSSAIAMEVDSTSVNDTAEGTGARTVVVHSLDANYDEQSETITMNGTTAVPLSGTHIRVQSIHTITNGAGGVAAGDITVQSVGGATVYDEILAGGNMSLQALFTVPNGQIAFATGWSGGLESTNKNTTGRIFLRATVDWNTRELLPDVFNFQDIILAQSGMIYKPFSGLVKFPAKCDIKLSAQRTQGAASIEAAGHIQLFHEDE